MLLLLLLGDGRWVMGDGVASDWRSLADGPAPDPLINTPPVVAAARIYKG